MTNREFNRILECMVKIRGSGNALANKRLDKFIDAAFEYTNAALAQSINVVPSTSGMEKEERDEILKKADEIEQRRSDTHDRLVLATYIVNEACSSVGAQSLYMDFPIDVVIDITPDHQEVQRMTKAYYKKYKTEYMSKKYRDSRHDLANWAWDLCVQMAIDNAPLDQYQDFDSTSLNSNGTVEECRKISRIYGDGAGAKYYFSKIIDAAIKKDKEMKSRGEGDKIRNIGTVVDKTK